MSALFGRKCQLIVAAAVTEDYHSVAVNVVDLSNLRVQFRITKDLEKHPNQGHIVISNLAQSTRTALQGVGVKVMLRAGYDDGTDLSQIFIGDVRTAQHERKDADWLSTLEAGDGERGYLYARINQTFPAGTRFPAIINALAKATGLELPSNVNLPNDQFVNGYVLSGRCSTELTKALKTSGYNWSIQDQKLQILPPGTANTTINVITLNADSGLIDSPQFGSASRTKGPPRLKVKALLQGGLVCGGRVNIDSKYHKGLHRILKVEHTGDTHGKAWFTEMECEPI